MNKDKILNSPNKTQTIILRLMILIGIISVFNFFYWFFSAELIGNTWLFSLLICLLTFDVFRLFYIWYHYWQLSVPQKPIQSKILTVDVLTTYFPGEPLEMVTQTLLAIKKIQYPHTTYLCDEADNIYLKEFCKDNGIIHVTRDNRTNAKAGNINNALKQAKGDICLILDPDHIPSKDFIEEVLPYFEDDTIGFVQTVQAYYNVNQSKVAKGAAQQTFHFYGPLMMGMQTYGTVNAIGANCVFRRKALDSIGGHASGLSEDMHTAMQLHAKGWKSVYLPKSYTKGLVPATLLSYYKQQLKWSRGTFELLLHVYPKLFQKFTWRQKIHYGVLPFHYLSGIMFMISFLIPIFSLLFSITPWKGNVFSFSLLIIPVLASVLGIRYYVQQWVIYKEERGIHILGGLLFQTTWWIYVIGVLYTFIGKKVLYLPTEKSDKEPTPFLIVVPNILVGVISVASIIIGLKRDLTPFSLVMAGFALCNALLMFYTLIFAYQKRRSYTLSDFLKFKNANLNSNFWDYIFKIISKSVLIILLAVIGGCGYLLIEKEKIKKNGIPVGVPNVAKVKYLGAFSPSLDNGITSLNLLNSFENKVNRSVDIVSFYYAWNKDIERNFSTVTLDSVYKRNALPLITWEPWLNSFENDSISNIHVFDLINDGYFDDFLKQTSLRFKNLKKPLFLRFAHEFDNPFYPWFDKREEASMIFKKAWIRVHKIFNENEAANVIWVWTPWKANNISDFFPGDDYVDWMGVDILNYGKKERPELNYSFKQLYDPFHNEFIKLSTKPVMVSEFGALQNSVNQERWIKNAFGILNYEFDEIQAIVCFNSNVDDNLPEKSEEDLKLNWTISSKELFLGNTFLTDKKQSDHIILNSSDKKAQDKIKKRKSVKLKGIRGINLKKGENWNRDYHVLSRQNLEMDFRNIKDLSINTLRFKENPVYDYNVLNLSEVFNLNICYGFHIPEHIDFVRDTLMLKALENHILNAVVKYKNKQHIIAWEFQNDVLSQQNKYFIKPELLFQRLGYLRWLNSLLEKINDLDEKRPVILSVDLTEQTLQDIDELSKYLNHLDYVGLVVKNKDDFDLEDITTKLKRLKVNYLFTDINLKVFENLKNRKIADSYFLSSWQDQHEMNRVSFDGMLDRKGRYKPEYFKFQSLINPENKIQNDAVKISILKQPKLTFNYNVLVYRALIYDSNKGWFIPNQENFEFEWELIKTDAYGNNLTIEEVGNDVELYLDIPFQSEKFKLQLSVVDGDKVYTHLTTLNTPYYVSEK